jgi:hypothetical protein
MPSDATYRPLKAYVAQNGGLRLSVRPDLRDRLVEWAVLEFPVDAPPEHVEEVLRARLAIRIRERHGSVIASLLIGVLLNLLVKLIIDWWFSRRSHRVLMEGWRTNALAGSHVPLP